MKEDPAKRRQTQVVGPWLGEAACPDGPEKL